MMLLYLVHLHIDYTGFLNEIRIQYSYLVRRTIKSFLSRHSSYKRLLLD